MVFFDGVPAAAPRLAALGLLFAFSVAQAADLLVSGAPDRNDAVNLGGAVLAGDAYVFASPATDIEKVVFSLDDTALSQPVQQENLEPFDFAGTDRDGMAKPFDTGQLAAGDHTISAQVTLKSGATQSIHSTFTVFTGNYALLNGSDAHRSDPVPLDGATLDGDAFVHVDPAAGLKRVDFFLDDPQLAGSAEQVERIAPWDLAGTGKNETALPFDTTQLADGSHNLTARLTLTDGSSELISATFGVDNSGTALLTASPSALQLSTEFGGAAADATLQAATSDGATPSYTGEVDAPWLAANGSGTLPDLIQVTADPSGLPAGSYAGNLALRADGYADLVVPVTFRITDDSGCSPLPCGELLVDLPYELDFDADDGKIIDGGGVGTGFTYVQPTSAGGGYLPANLQVDTALGELVVTTTAGLFHTTTNSQDNALGIGIDAPSQVTELSTTLIDPHVGSGDYQQAGLWFGTDEDNYVKLVVVATPKGTRIQRLHEIGGGQVYEASQAANVSGQPVTLLLTLDPANRTVTSAYRIGDGGLTTLGKAVAVPEELFSFDAAGIDPTIGTRSFGGILASHRQGTTPLQYRFGHFAARAVAPAVVGTHESDFVRSSHPLPSPTAMVWGPDGRLYVTELLGLVHALRYDADGAVIDDELITALTDDLGARLALGITIDPASTPDNVVLWLAHSSPSLDEGVPNSGMVSRLSGPGFTSVEHVVTGLPRAEANHATNAIHFGPDGRLYIAQGGNTGAGAPNTADTEFGTMAEQPLSAALLVADVYAPSFDGSCDNTEDIFGPPPCDLEVYASGLRNTYDFVFHSNGQLYAPDNGLGVAGSFPPSPTPPCLGLGSTVSWTEGGNNPGTQPDILNRLEQGMYYGHPNPSREECVFKDGSYQETVPLPNWRPPLAILGDNTSSNGIVEYPADTACGTLKGDLLIANFSVGDHIVRFRPSVDGTAAIGLDVFLSRFNNPLPLATTIDGRIAVGELGGDRITLLRPVELGCWSTHGELPVPLLDAAGAALDGKLYAVAGKTADGHVSSLHVYDPVGDSWSLGPDLPGAAVENPAAAVLNGRLYVFGGSTGPFSGAVNSAAVYDPAAGAWTELAPMPTARGGGAAGALNGLIYVVGGIGSDGASVATVEVYDPASDVWSSAPSLSIRRDNPGAAVLDGRLYVFGGRTRDADGTEVDGTLNTVEAFDPISGTWSARAPMPTGRRAMVVGNLNGRAQLIGGERAADGETFPQNEQYDPLTDTWRTLRPMPSPRHGAAGATIGDRVYVAGGGPDAGSSFTTLTDSFGF